MSKLHSGKFTIHVTVRLTERLDLMQSVYSSMSGHSYRKEYN